MTDVFGQKATQSQTVKRRDLVAIKDDKAQKASRNSRRNKLRASK